MLFSWVGLVESWLVVGLFYASIPFGHFNSSQFAAFELTHAPLPASLPRYLPRYLATSLPPSAAAGANAGTATIATAATATATADTVRNTTRQAPGLTRASGPELALETRLLGSVCCRYDVVM